MTQAKRIAIATTHSPTLRSDVRADAKFGLTRQSYAPSLMAATAVVISPWPDSITAAMPASCACTCRSTARPSMVGMLTSHSSTSTSCCSRWASASSPEAAASTIYPSWLRSASRERRWLQELSTTKMLTMRVCPRNAIVLGLLPLAGGRPTFQGDFHPLDGEHNLGPLAGVCEVNNDPVLIPHGGDVTAASEESASANGQVMAAEVLDVSQVINVANRIGAADACPPNGESIDAARIFFPPKGHNAPAPSVAGAHGA